MGLIETINSGYNAAVVSAQNHRGGLGPIVTCNSGAKVAVLNAKNMGEVWDQQRLVFQVIPIVTCNSGG